MNEDSGTTDQNDQGACVFSIHRCSFAKEYLVILNAQFSIGLKIMPENKIIKIIKFENLTLIPA